MAIYNIEDVIAIFDGEKLLCADCLDLEQLQDVSVEVYEERNRVEGQLLLCDNCNKII